MKDKVLLWIVSFAISATFAVYALQAMASCSN
jgi:hypothetical protein